MTTQISPKNDAALNDLSRRIGREKKKIEEATAEHDALWTEVLDIFDEFGREGRAARFIANDGFYLFKQTNGPKPQLDATGLKEAIFSKYSATKAQRIWNEICEQSVNSALLEAAIQKKRLPAELVAPFITEKNGGFSRIRREWTADDKEKAVLFGIEKVEEDVVTT